MPPISLGLRTASMCDARTQDPSLDRLNDYLGGDYKKGVRLRVDGGKVKNEKLSVRYLR